MYWDMYTVNVERKTTFIFDIPACSALNGAGVRGQTIHRTRDESHDWPLDGRTNSWKFEAAYVELMFGGERCMSGDLFINNVGPTIEFDAILTVVLGRRENVS